MAAAIKIGTHRDGLINEPEDHQARSSALILPAVTTSFLNALLL
jgi:hypothetical protein